MLTWLRNRVIRLLNRGWVHVMPTDDLVDHESSESCACGPRAEKIEGGTMYVHQRLDGKKWRWSRG